MHLQKYFSKFASFAAFTYAENQKTTQAHIKWLFAQLKCANTQISYYLLIFLWKIIHALKTEMDLELKNLSAFTEENYQTLSSYSWSEPNLLERIFLCFNLE